MSALSVILGLGAGICLISGPWTGRGAAVACLTVGAFAAWSGAWAAVGPALALAALLGRRDEALRPQPQSWAPLTLCALTALAVAGWMARWPSPPSPTLAATAPLEALRDEPWLALGAAAMVVFTALTADEERP
jgi:hypothetical protein